MEIKKLSDCTLQEIVTAWNRGFTGYLVQLEMNETAFITRLVSEGLSLEHSIVTFVNNEPVGIITNGFRTIDGKQMAWNGGTGIAPEFRGKGLIKQMISLHSNASNCQTQYELRKGRVIEIFIYKFEH